MFLAGGAALWPLTARFPGSAANFPRLILILIAILSLAMLARTLVPSLAPVSWGEGRQSAGSIVLPVATLLLATLAVHLMRFIGFFPAAAGFGLGLMALLSVRRRITYLLAYAGLLLFIFVVFVLVLNVPLTDTHLWGG